MRRALLALLALLTVGLIGCKRAPESEEDRTVRKLREAAALTTPAPPDAAQAPAPGARAGAEPQAIEPVGSPKDWAFHPRPFPPAAAGRLGQAEARVLGLAEGQTVAGPKVVVTTTQSFLKVTLALRNPTPRALTLDLRGARLSWGAGQAGPAPDVQHAAGSPLSEVALEAGQEERVVLYFELARAERGRRLQLELPDGGGHTLTLPLG